MKFTGVSRGQQTCKALDFVRYNTDVQVASISGERSNGYGETSNLFSNFYEARILGRHATGSSF